MDREVDEVAAHGAFGALVNRSRFLYGDFLTARRRTEPPVDSPTHPCPQCLSEIPRAATRCAFCTPAVAAVQY